ncbi:MAG: UPF0280 family protein [Candidatus Hodarchaeaceae archaeon]|nr:UPF0280 family protein [Candidatus Hodarchaeaceae archaeon]
MAEKPLISERWTYKQTDVLIKADGKEAIGAAKRSIMEHRNSLERYIARNPLFELSLEPVEVEANAPRVVKLMAEAAELAGVGPIAAVAGALAQLAVEDGIAAGARNVLVDNGGDIFIHGDRSYTVAIHAGTSPLSNKLALEVSAEKLPIAICTSSATVGPSLSFGGADAATLLASSGALADAAATAVCNATRGNPERAIRAGMERARAIAGVRAALIIYGEHLGSWGDLPKLIIADRLSEELIKRVQIQTV